MHLIDIVTEKIKNDVDLRCKTREAWRVEVDGRWVLYCAGCGEEINTSFTPVERGHYHVPAHGRCVAGVKAHFALQDRLQARVDELAPELARMT